MVPVVFSDTSGTEAEAVSEALAVDCSETTGAEAVPVADSSDTVGLDAEAVSEVLADALAADTVFVAPVSVEAEEAKTLSVAVLAVSDTADVSNALESVLDACETDVAAEAVVSGIELATLTSVAVL